MWRYYQSYLGSVLLVDGLVFAGLWLRFGILLKPGWARRLVRRLA